MTKSLLIRLDDDECCFGTPRYSFVPPEPVFHENAPPNHVMVAVGGGERGYILSAIGRDIGYMEECDYLANWFDACGLEPGIWVIECRLVGHKYWTDCGYEYDVELEFDEVRAATDEEIDQARGDEWPWDPERWIANWDAIQKWTPDAPRCIGTGEKSGCGWQGGKSGDTCPECGGMVLDGEALREADRLAREVVDTEGLAALQTLLRTVRGWMDTDSPTAPEIIEAAGPWIEAGCPGLIK